MWCPGFDPLVYLNSHQGLTHSLVLMPAWAALLTSLAARWYGRRWRDFYGPALLGVLAHIAGDLITAYGTEVFAPLSFERYAYPIAFVLDPYFTAVTAGGLWLSVHRDSRLAAQIGLATLLTYVGLLAALRAEALDMGRDVANERGLGARNVAALPQPFTPLNWKLLISEGIDRPRGAPAASAVFPAGPRRPLVPRDRSRLPPPRRGGSRRPPAFRNRSPLDARRP